MLQYVMANLTVALMPGNKFLNGILLGSAECFAMVFSRFLLKRFDDMKAFKIIYAIGAISYLILVMFPSSPRMTYLAVILMVTCIGGWDNISLLIVELRVPPNNVAAVSLMLRTVAVSSGILAPTISALPPPLPYIFSLCLATAGFIASLYLPKAGTHLPAVEKTADDNFKLVDKDTEEPTPIHNR